MIANATPGGTPYAEQRRIADEAFEVIRRGKRWTGPDGEKYVAIFHPAEVRRGNPDPQIVGYRKLRAKEWFVAKEGEVLYGPLPTKRGALRQVGAKKGKIEAPGWYRADGHDIFTRGMAETVLGRGLTEEER